MATIKGQIEEKLTDALDKTVEFYLNKLRDGDLSAAEQKNLIQLFRDNQITIDPKSANPLEDLVNGDFSEFNTEGFTVGS
jgi:hypothetical protein